FFRLKIRNDLDPVKPADCFTIPFTEPCGSSTNRPSFCCFQKEDAFRGFMGIRLEFIFKSLSCFGFTGEFAGGSHNGCPKRLIVTGEVKLPKPIALWKWNVW